MRTDLPTVLALAAKGNAFFRGSMGRMEVLAGHPAFARFHDLAFVRQAGLTGGIVADSSVPWFRRLRLEGADRIRPLLSGMRLDKGADAPWGLLTEGDKGLELWSPTMNRRFQGHDDQQPLRLTMTAGRFDRWSLPPVVTVDEVTKGLYDALRNAQQLLESSGQSVAAGVVGKFVRLHESESPDASDLASIVPDLEPCAVPLFASGARVLTLLMTTGWATASDGAARALGEPLWTATRLALETSV